MIQRPEVAWLNLRGFAFLLWWHDFRLGTARQVWRQSFGMRMKNPSRLMAYLNAYAIGASMIRRRSGIRAGVEGFGQDHYSDLPQPVKSSTGPISSRG